jgi:hypothetical protein
MFLYFWNLPKACTFLAASESIWNSHLMSLAYWVAQRSILKTFNVFFMLPGLMAPFLISIVMIFTSKNSYLKKDFVNRLINPRLIQPKMLLQFFKSAILCGGFNLSFSSILGIDFAVSICWRFLFLIRICPCLLLLLLPASFEELGWRGYAFDSRRAGNLPYGINYFQYNMVTLELFTDICQYLLSVKGFSWQFLVWSEFFLFASSLWEWLSVVCVYKIKKPFSQQFSLIFLLICRRRCWIYLRRRSVLRLWSSLLLLLLLFY